jgi:hypothetical protein
VSGPGEESAPPQPEAPNVRQFSLNSPEAYAALCEQPDPWLWGPCLRREPRVWEGWVERGGPALIDALTAANNMSTVVDSRIAVNYGRQS